MPPTPFPTRSGAAHLSVLTSVVAVTGAAGFAVVEGAVPGSGEPILIGAVIAGAGMVVVALAREIVTMRDMTIRTHDGLFDPERGVFHTLDKHHERANRHSAALRAAELLND